VARSTTDPSALGISHLQIKFIFVYKFTSRFILTSQKTHENPLDTPSTPVHHANKGASGGVQVAHRHRIPEKIRVINKDLSSEWEIT
jgi:hypothetical protein